MDKNSYKTYWVFSNDLQFIEEAEKEWQRRQSKRAFRLLKKNIMDCYSSLNYAEQQAQETGHITQFEAYREKLLEMKGGLEEREKQICESEPSDYNVIDFGDGYLNEEQLALVRSLKDNSLNLRCPPTFTIKALLEMRGIFDDEGGQRWFEKTLERLQNGFQRNQHTDEWVKFADYDEEAKSLERYYKRHPEEKKDEISKHKIPTF